MKLNCGPDSTARYDARHARLSNWHPFFALWPRRITGTNECRWLETIQRKGTFLSSWDSSWWTWEYKL